MRPAFRAGRNIAMKVPPHEYGRTVAFYEDVLGFRRIADAAPGSAETVAFEFGDKVLWIDNVPGMSQAELWLEVWTDDHEAAAGYLAEQGCVRCDGIEPLPEGFKGFWVSSPANVIHLITTPGEEQQKKNDAA